MHLVESDKKSISSNLFTNAIATMFSYFRDYYLPAVFCHVDHAIERISMKEKKKSDHAHQALM